MIDQTCRARLADFGLLTVVSNSMKLFSSSTTLTNGGTLRWMSPERIAPGKFGLETSRPTRSSDCYSLGMVAYEAFSGKKPFHETLDLAVFLKVVEGERPSRVVGFTDSLWEMMEQCWMSHPDQRPNVEGVLEYFEMCSTGEDLGSDSLISTSAVNDNLYVLAPLVNTFQDTSGVEPRTVSVVSVSGGPIVPLDNQSVDSVSWFYLCPPAPSHYSPPLPQF